MKPKEIDDIQNKPLLSYRFLFYSIYFWLIFFYILEIISALVIATYTFFVMMTIALEAFDLIEERKEKK